MRVCDSCGEENSDDALVCADCGEKLDIKKKKTNGSSKFYSKKVLLVIFMAVIIIFGLYFSNYFNADTVIEIEIESPDILIESVIITEIERDWLENNTWQIGATVLFKISNSNDFDINITIIDFSVEVIDDGKYARIYDGFFNLGLVSSEGFLSHSESFWFLSDEEGVNELESVVLHFNVSGTAIFFMETLSSYQDGFVNFSGEV